MIHNDKFAKWCASVRFIKINLKIRKSVKILNGKEFKINCAFVE